MYLQLHRFKLLTLGEDKYLIQIDSFHFKPKLTFSGGVSLPTAVYSKTHYNAQSANYSFTKMHFNQSVIKQ